MEKHLHIISFDVPYPVNYGGVVDLFYKLPALQAEGVKIHLHCFAYGRSEQTELNKYCDSVNYYERFLGHKGTSNTLPYIVSSRKNERLLENLLKDDYPILMEGIHCTYLLFDERFNNRKCFVRVHNVEFQYYHDLYKNTSSPIKKLYYWLENRLLKAYEKKVANRACFWGVTENITTIYRNVLECNNIAFLPVYIPNWKVQSAEGMGNYCLYHGDLALDVNEKAAIWLLKNIFSTLKIPFVIAGKNPSIKLEKIAHENKHTCLVANPSEKEMQDMIVKAHINIIPSYSTTGIKIKLLNALFNGRHCVVNEATIEGSGLGAACHMATSANSFQEIISQLYHQPFSSNEIDIRKELLTGMFNNEVNAKKMVEWIWGLA